VGYLALPWSSLSYPDYPSRTTFPDVTYRPRTTHLSLNIDFNVVEESGRRKKSDLYRLGFDRLASALGPGWGSAGFRRETFGARV
jgi:hypothetical protein